MAFSALSINRLKLFLTLGVASVNAIGALSWLLGAPSLPWSTRIGLFLFAAANSVVSIAYFRRKLQDVKAQTGN